MSELKGLLGATEIREIAARIGVTPTKKLGQNFVVDANVCRKIVSVADVSPNDIVVEIGPGLGSLSLAIIESAKHLLAVEIDTRLAAELPQTFARHEVATDAFTIINQDALAVDELPMRPDVLVANLPYNISVSVLLHFFERFPTLRSGVVMVQSEVADRLAAVPGSKSYGSPSVKATWWMQMSAAGGVARSIFWPVPNVDSSLVKFVRHEPAGDEALRLRTFEIIDAAFAQRRKMLRAALSGMFGGSSQASAVIESAGIDPTLRGEALLLPDFIKIAEASHS